MLLLEFYKKYKGKKVDYDGHFGAQCVDLFRQYCVEVLNIPHTGSVVSAKDLYEKYDQLPKEQQYFERIPYTGQLPKEGDVVVFGASKTNRWGHVAIVISTDGKGLLVFEQDGFLQDGAKITLRDYKRVLGFLRKRSA